MKPVDKLRMDELLKIKAIVLNEEKAFVTGSMHDDKPVRRRGA
jgi:hypothetical protein